MITLLDILQWERLTKRSFTTFEQHEDDIIIMMYCHDHVEQRKHSLDVYLQAMRENKNKAWAIRDITRFTTSIKKDMDFTMQFISKNKTEQKPSHDKEERELHRITPYILKFLMDGISPDWLLCQGVEWLEILAEAHEIKAKEKYKYDRFWHSLYFGFQFDKKHSGDYMKLMKSLETEDEKEKRGRVVMSEAQELSIGRALWRNRE